MVLAGIRANPPRCDRHFREYTTTRDEWTSYSGEQVDALSRIALDRLHALEAAGADTETLRDQTLASPQKAICAALREYPVPCYRSDIAEIDALADAIDAALAASERRAA